MPETMRGITFKSPRSCCFPRVSTLWNWSAFPVSGCSVGVECLYKQSHPCAGRLLFDPVLWESDRHCFPRFLLASVNASASCDSLRERGQDLRLLVWRAIVCTLAYGCHPEPSWGRGGSRTEPFCASTVALQPYGWVYRNEESDAWGSSRKSWECDRHQKNRYTSTSRTWCACVYGGSGHP